MPLPIPLSAKPMVAEPVDQLLREKNWLYEPKYDGFRCLAFRDGDRVEPIKAAATIRATARAQSDQY